MSDPTITEALSVLRRILPDIPDPEERAALAALLATFERLAGLPALWGCVNTETGQQFSSTTAQSPAEAESYRKMFFDTVPLTIRPLTLAAMLEDET